MHILFMGKISSIKIIKGNGHDPLNRLLCKFKVKLGQQECTWGDPGLYCLLENFVFTTHKLLIFSGGVIEFSRKS